MKEYGLLYYDIPFTEMNLYYKLRRTIDHKCVPVNLSVYIFDWALKDYLEQRINIINVNKRGNISFVKFDNASSEQLEVIATQQLTKIFEQIKERLFQSMKKIENTKKKEGYLDRTIRKLKSYENLLTIYEFTRVIEPALEVLKKMIKEEYEKLI